MIHIGILSLQTGYHRGATDFYPLIKWNRLLKREGYSIRFFSSHLDKKIYSSDVVIIDYRYYRMLTIHEKKYPDSSFIKEFMEDLKQQGIKVILFDTGDGAGGRQWDLINHVDIFWKKQVLKDRLEYTLNKGRSSYMVFLPEYDLSKHVVDSNLAYQNEYKPCPEDQLHKIRVAWNIGMVDYRAFPFSNFYPVGTSRLLNSLYQAPVFYEKLDEKSIDSVFRGKIKKDKENYAYQRNKVIELFQKDMYPGYITGEIVPRKIYLDEMRKSKTCVSPFGWGEVCFRDFEAIINGCLLIKPDMDHLETWPDLYRENETYVSIRWDMSDLEKTLNEVVNHFDDYKPLIKYAQQLYNEAITDGERFVKRFKSILKK